MGVWDVDPGVEVEEVGLSEGIFSCGDDMRAIQNQLVKVLSFGEYKVEKDECGVEVETVIYVGK